MAEVVAEKPVCGKCGSDVRGGTAYCYNCGASVVGTSPEPLEESIPVNTESNGETVVGDKAQVDGAKAGNVRLKRAANERKKARVSSRKPVEYRWEPTDDLRFPLLWAVIVTVIVIAIVSVMVFWK